MADDQEAARGQPVPVAGQDFAWAVLVRDEMQRAGAQHRDRPGQVQQRLHVGVVQDRFRVTQVGVHHHHPVRLGQQRLAMGPDHRVVVHVGDPRGRGIRQRRLVHAELGRQSGAQVNKLLDTCVTGNVAHRPGQERPAVPGNGRDIRNRGEQLGRGGAVNGEVVLATKQEVINPGHVGRRHIHAAWNGHRLHHLERNTVPRILAKISGVAGADRRSCGPRCWALSPLSWPFHQYPVTRPPSATPAPPQSSVRLAPNVTPRPERPKNGGTEIFLSELAVVLPLRKGPWSSAQKSISSSSLSSCGGTSERSVLPVTSVHV